MGTGIADGIGDIGMGQILGRLSGVEGEAQDLHAGEAGLIAQVQHFLGQEAQVLSDQAQLGQALLHGIHEGHAGSLDPLAATGGLVAVGHVPVGLEAAEMVQTDSIIPLSGSSQTAQPPGEAVFFHLVPAVQGVAPELTVGGEGIGRAAGYAGGAQGSVQLEQLGAGPDLHGVVGDIDGHVADDGDAAFPGMVPEGVPLAGEDILDEALEADLITQLVAGVPDRVGVPELEAVLPVEPALAGMLLQSHEEGEVGQPAAVLGAEAVEIGAAGEAVVGLAQDRELVIVLDAEIGLVIPVAPGDGADLLLSQQTLLDQLGQVDQVGVAGEGGAGLVRGIAVAGGGQGQDLPLALAGFLQEVHEVMSFFAHGADAVRAGQARYMHQNAAASHRILLLV